MPTVSHKKEALMPELPQDAFDNLYSWLQVRCNARPSRQGLRYTCAHTFEHTKQWLNAHGLAYDGYLAHLQAHGITCDCAILQKLTDWP